MKEWILTNRMGEQLIVRAETINDLAEAFSIGKYDLDNEMSEVVKAEMKDAVKEGKWVEHEDAFGDTYYDCSVCGESWVTIDGTPWQNGMNYCPHCGVRMDAGGKWIKTGAIE